MQGRPQLFPNSRQISVLVSANEYATMAALIEKERVARPGFTFGDLLRGFIRKCLSEEDVKPLAKLPPSKDRVRRLHAIARSAVSLAHELDGAKK